MALADSKSGAMPFRQLEVRQSPRSGALATMLAHRASAATTSDGPIWTTKGRVPLVSDSRALRLWYPGTTARSAQLSEIKSTRSNGSLFTLGGTSPPRLVACGAIYPFLQYVLAKSDRPGVFRFFQTITT